MTLDAVTRNLVHQHFRSHGTGPNEKSRPRPTGKNPNLTCGLGWYWRRTTHAWLVKDTTGGQAETRAPPNMFSDPKKCSTISTNVLFGWEAVACMGTAVYDLVATAHHDLL